MERPWRLAPIIQRGEKGGAQRPSLSTRLRKLADRGSSVAFRRGNANAGKSAADYVGEPPAREDDPSYDRLLEL